VARSAAADRGSGPGAAILVFGVCVDGVLDGVRGKAAGGAEQSVSDRPALHNTQLMAAPCRRTTYQGAALSKPIAGASL